MSSSRAPLTEWPSSDLEHLGACPVCNSKQRKIAFSNLVDRFYRCAPGTWTMYRCSECRSGYLDPRPDRASIGRAYETYVTHRDNTNSPSFFTQLLATKSLHSTLRNSYINSTYGTNLSPANPKLSFVYRKIPHFRARVDRLMGHQPAPKAGHKLLEIGCGGGQFLQWMSSLGWSTVGIEPDPKAAEIARRRGMDVRNQMIDDLDFPDHSFHGICMNHVIEHCHDPISVLTNCRRWLAPGGILSLATPNFASLGSLVFGPDWLPLLAPTHLVLFTTSSLRKALISAGFHDVQTYATSFSVENSFAPSRQLQRDSGRWKTNIMSRLLGNKRVGTAAAFFPRWSEEIDITGIA